MYSEKNVVDIDEHFDFSLLRKACSRVFKFTYTKPN